jgi:hypothetical protein
VRDVAEGAALPRRPYRTQHVITFCALPISVRNRSPLTVAFVHDKPVGEQIVNRASQPPSKGRPSAGPPCFRGPAMRFVPRPHRLHRRADATTPQRLLDDRFGHILRDGRDLPSMPSRRRMMSSRAAHSRGMSSSRESRRDAHGNISSIMTGRRSAHAVPPAALLQRSGSRVRRRHLRHPQSVTTASSENA